MSDSYELRIYDKTLISFSLNSSQEGETTAEINHAFEPYEFYPLDLEVSNEGILRWLESRIIPKNRIFVKEILNTFGLKDDDIKGITDICKALSLNDSYWVVPEGFEGRFADFNLYENRFSEVLSLVAYTGVKQEDFSFIRHSEMNLPKEHLKAMKYSCANAQHS